VFDRLAIAVDSASLYGQRVLDIGCDTGAFLQAAVEQFGITPVGVDVSHTAVAASRARGIEAYHTAVETAPAHLSGYAAITAIDVLEHVTDANGFLRAIRDRLRPCGAVYIETSNIRSVVYRLGAALSNLTHGRPIAVFERLFPPQHVQYFTKAGLVMLARDSGLEVVQIGARVLPWSAIAASIPVRLALLPLQVLDRLVKTEILVWCVLRRP
jgi:2-polyprenyl-3-methyl-5-hydroxy-6-metoxy-1,4-benzoquinol methylase